MKKPKKDFARLALRAHKELRGKIQITLKENITSKEDLSTFYTPGVAAVSALLSKEKDTVGKYTMKGNLVAVISDGSAVLGLGNIGPEGAYPVMEGKAMLFKSLAGIDAMPILLSTQDPREIVSAIKAIAPTFGGINLEDIAAPKCFDIERELQEALDIPVLHDDQHGTALVVLSGVINALKVVKKNAGKVRVVVNGAGAAGQAIGKMLFLYGITDIILLDSKGIISPYRSDLDSTKRDLLTWSNVRSLSGDLSAALQGADLFIGVSKGGTLPRSLISQMAKDPIIFALANPTPEIMPDEAWAAGATVVATGRSDFPNQVNNSLGFPGIFRGALDHGVRQITDHMLVQAAKNLAALISKPTPTKIIPDVFDKRVVRAVAKAIH